MPIKSTDQENNFEVQLAEATGWEPDALLHFLTISCSKTTSNGIVQYVPNLGDKKTLYEFVRGLIKRKAFRTKPISQSDFHVEYLEFYKNKVNDRDYKYLNQILKPIYPIWKEAEREKVLKQLLLLKLKISSYKYVLFPSEEIHTSVEETILKDDQHCCTPEDFIKGVKVELKNRAEKVSLERSGNLGGIAQQHDSIDPLVLLFFSLERIPHVQIFTRSPRIIFLSNLMYETFLGYLINQQNLPKNKKDLSNIIRNESEKKYPGNELAYRKMQSETITLIQSLFVNLRSKTKKRQTLNELYLQGTTFNGIPKQSLNNRTNAELKFIAEIFIEYVFPKKRGLRYNQ
jgi:hypothetical protein